MEEHEKWLKPYKIDAQNKKLNFQKSNVKVRGTPPPQPTIVSQPVKKVALTTKVDDGDDFFSHKIEVPVVKEKEIEFYLSLIHI